MTAIIVMSIGIIGGLCIYKLYARDQMHRFRTAWYSIPYDASTKAQYSMDEQLAMEFEKAIRPPKNFFSEQFEIDVENQIQKIDVPDFRGGRQGRFIHDFNIVSH